MPPSENKDVEEETGGKEWTSKRFFNTHAFRSMAVLGTLAVAGYSSSSKSSTSSVSSSSSLVLSSKMGATVHVLSFATWFGTNFYTTFVLGITMFNNLPRKTFGTLQSKLFPKYFMLCSSTLVLQVSTVCSCVLSRCHQVFLRLRVLEKLAGCLNRNDCCYCIFFCCTDLTTYKL